jgi:predicted metalloendopeptidase
MIDTLMEEFLFLLRNSEWMDDETREKAVVKAMNMRRNIGYPDFMDDPALVDEIYSNVRKGYYDEENF